MLPTFDTAEVLVIWMHLSFITAFAVRRSMLRSEYLMFSALTLMSALRFDGMTIRREYSESWAVVSVVTIWQLIKCHNTLLVFLKFLLCGFEIIRLVKFVLFPV